MKTVMSAATLALFVLPLSAAATDDATGIMRNASSGVARGEVHVVFSRGDVGVLRGTTRRGTATCRRGFRRSWRERVTCLQAGSGVSSRSPLSSSVGWSSCRLTIAAASSTAMP